ncbi:MAG: hypothetical protein SNG14_06385 [Rikenellaceae bacterium]
MKHLIFPSLLFAAAAVTSCAEDAATDLPISGLTNSNLITLDMASSATKGSDIDATFLQDNTNVVLSYIDGSTSNTIEFDYNDTDYIWKQTAQTPLMWSDISYPMQVYSMNDGENKTLTYDADTAILSYNVTDAIITNHKDLLYLSKTISSMPSAGIIRGVFDHALSKVEFTLTTTDATDSAPDSGYEVSLLTTQFCQPYNDGTATITAADGTIAWGSQNSRQGYYEYLNLKASNLTTTSAEQTYTNVIAEKIEPEATNDPAAATNANWNMMLIPQTIYDGYSILDALTETPSSLSSAMDEEPYIEVLYRMDDEHGEAIAGAANATDYINSLDDSVYSTLNKSSARSDYGNTPLYVRVAFAFSQDYDLEASTYYQLDLDFYNHGGIVVDEYYYDQTGTKTNIPIDDDLEVGEPVIPTTDSQICLTITVSSWGDPTTTDVD